MWKSVLCVTMACVIGGSGFIAGTLPVYGETETVNRTELDVETEVLSEVHSGTDAVETESAEVLFEEPAESAEMDDEEPEESTESVSPSEGTVHEKVPLYEENERAGFLQRSYTQNGLTLTVTYPAQIKCGEETIFQLSVQGGSGNYKYRFGSLMTYDGFENVAVYDTSYGSNGAYKESDEVLFTFCASGIYKVSFGAMDMSNHSTVNMGFVNGITLDVQDPLYPSVEQIVNQVAAECLKTCSTDFEKAVWLHDWVIDHAEYDHSYSFSSAEGVLARKSGTCEAYHRAYVMLLNKVGISTGRIVSDDHVWTAVKMDGEWYQVDTTWDDLGSKFQGTYYEHMYFGMTDYITALVHPERKTPVDGYESVSLENNYFIKTGDIKRWSDPVADQIRQNLNGGKMDFTLPVTDSMPDNYKNVIYNLVAYQLSEKENWNGIPVSVSYKDRQLTVKAGTVADVPHALMIVPPSKTVYKVGETVSLSGLVVTAVYASGTKVQVLNGNEYRVEGFDTKTVGSRTATVTYKGVSASFAYTVKEPPTDPVKPTDPVTPTVPDASIRYRTHVQSYGNQGWRQDGQMSGTSGESKRLEGIYIELVNPPMEGKVQYRTHIQSYGWEKSWKENGQMSGTSGEKKRLEAIQIKLTGKMAECYDVYYRVHAQSYGWLGWAKNGASAGTAGYGKRLEGIEVRLVKKGAPAPGSSIGSFRQAGADAGINYRTHVQSFGWQAWKANGEMSGTSGQAKRLEGIEVKVDNLGISGGVQYKTHIQSYGWEKDWKRNGQMSGTSGQAKRLEAIQIQLTGELGRRYDVYYRVHAQSYGWLDWAKNGASAGTAGYAKRLEGIEIRLVEKGGPAPGPTGRPYVAK